MSDDQINHNDALKDCLDVLHNIIDALNSRPYTHREFNARVSTILLMVNAVGRAIESAAAQGFLSPVDFRKLQTRLRMQLALYESHMNDWRAANKKPPKEDA